MNGDTAEPKLIFPFAGIILPLIIPPLALNFVLAAEYAEKAIDSAVFAVEDALFAVEDTELANYLKSEIFKECL